MLSYKEATRTSRRRVNMLYAKGYEVIIVIIVLLWVFGQLRGHGSGR